MKGYERHHQIMLNIMKENPTFQKVMNWALSRKPPLTIGFNEFKQNIIILAKEQHGYHNLMTKEMHFKMDKVKKILDKSEKLINVKIDNLKKRLVNDKPETFLEAFEEIKFILKIEERRIVKEIIQVNNAKLK